MRGPLVGLVFSPRWAHASARVLHMPAMPGTYATHPPTLALPLSECVIAIPRFPHANAVSRSLLVVLPVPRRAAAPPYQSSTALEQSRHDILSLAQLPSSSSCRPPCWVAVTSVRRSSGSIASTMAAELARPLQPSMPRWRGPLRTKLF
jgi:hypothetical protein